MGLFDNLFEKKRDDQALSYSIMDDRDGEYALSYDVTEYYVKAEEACHEKKYQDCIDYISKEIKASGREIPPYFLLKGKAYAFMENHKDALICFNKVLSMRPDHLFANEFKAVSLIMMNDFKGAIDSLSKIIEKKPKHPVFYELRAEAYEKSGNIEKRNQDTRKFNELTGEKRPILTKEGTYSLKDTVSGDVYEGLTKYGAVLAIEAGRNKKYQECLDYINKEFSITQEIPPLLVLRAQAYVELKNFNAALKDVNKVLSGNPGLQKANLTKATILERMGDIQGAIASISQAIEETPDNAFYYSTRSDLYHKVGNLKKEEQDTRKFNELTGEKGAILTKEGTYSLKDIFSGDVYEGLTKYGAVLAIEAGRNKKYQECLDYINKEFSITQEIPPLLVLRAQAYVELKNFDAALKDVNKVLSGNPGYQEANLTKATILEMMGDIQGAIASISQAIKQTPDNAFYYSTRSDLYHKVGNLKKEEQDSKKFRKLIYKYM